MLNVVHYMATEWVGTLCNITSGLISSLIASLRVFSVRYYKPSFVSFT